MRAMAEDRRAHLIESAVQLFAREGIDAANTGAVAKNAGVAAGTLFNYFRSKTDLIRSAYLSCKTDAAAAMRAPIDPQAAVRGNLFGIWETAVAWHLDHPDASNFMEQFRNSPAAKEEELKERAGEEFSFLCELVERGQKDGQIVELPMDYLDSIFRALFLSTVAYMRSQGMQSEDPFVGESFSVLWRAIGRRS